MCLQWCHVRDILIDNDLPCALWCPEAIRLAHAGDACETCRHRRGALCRLTQERLPLARTCCHWNAERRAFEFVVLRMGLNVPPELAAAHHVKSTRRIFEMVDTAPDLPPEAPEDGILLSAADLSVPLVYGVCAACWEEALTGESDLWCRLCRESV